MGTTLMVDEVLYRVQQLTHEIEEVRGEICNHIFPSEEPQNESLFSQAAAVEIMTQFKAAIDDIRHVVWLYLEAVEKRPTLEADPQRKLLVRATEILGALSQRPPLPMPYPAVGEHSLLDRLLVLIDSRIDPKMMGRQDSFRKNRSPM